MLLLLTLGAEARAGEFLGAPEPQARPWPILKNTMTTVGMRLFAVKTDQAPAIDGKLDDPAWQKAFSVSTFGREAFKGYTHRKNSVRLLYDDAALYVGCTGEISGWQPWLAQARPRDGGAWQDDAFEVFLDPGLTRKDYWQFIVNAVGSIEDHRGWDAKPNPDWKVAVSHTETTWTAEFAIPFASIGASAPKKGDVWGLNVFRDDKELRESYSVSPVLDSAHDASRFLPLEFGDVPEVFLDFFRFDKIAKGDNVLKFKALGRGVEGAAVKGGVRTMDGKAVGEAREVPLGAAETAFPFTIVGPGQSKLDLEILKDGKAVGRYSFLINIYEERLLIPVLGGMHFYQGRPRINLRLDVRLKEELLPSYQIELAVKQGANVLKQSRIEKIPGVFSRCDMNVADLAAGRYTLEATLLGPDGKAADRSTAPLDIIQGPFTRLPMKARVRAGDAEPIPEQFTVWGAVGKDIAYRRCTPEQVEKMKKEGKTEAEIERANWTYDCRHWPEVQDEAQKPKTVFTDEEQRRGYVVFGRPYVQQVFYYTVPAAEERIGELSAFAAQGQYEPITFSVHALKELKEVKAEVSALAGPGGSALAPQSFDVRVVRCYEKAYGSPWWDPEKQDRKTGLPQKEVIPLTLEKRPSISIPAGQSRQFWITLKVPETCKAGLYEGLVKLSAVTSRGLEARGRLTQALPLRVRVLPFQLAPLDKVTFMDNAPVERDALIDYREHGFNTIQLDLALPPQAQSAVEAAFRKFDKTGKLDGEVPLPTVDEMMKFNKPRLDRVIDTAKQAGLKARMVYFSFFCWVLCGWNGDWFKYFPASPALEERYAGYVNATIAYAKERGFPEFVLFCGDEPGGHPQTLPDIRHWLQVAKERCPGLKTGMPVGGGLSMGIDELGQLGPNLDIFDTNFLNADILRGVRERKLDLWICNAGSMAVGDPRLDRYGYGFFAWKVGVQGMAQWVYRGGNVYEQAYGLGTAYVFPAADGKPLPTIHWEAMRQAFIDQRYAATLTRLIGLARQSDDPKAKEAADQAAGAIQEVLSQFSEDYMNRRFPASVWRPFYLNSVDGDYYETCRWRLAQEILKLQAVLGEKAVLEPVDR
jgi:hypothetical protein